LSSFTRTIPSEKDQTYVDQILSKSDLFIPLAYRPNRANQGDFIYLVFRGRIVGRARITRIDSAASTVEAKTNEVPRWAKWLIWYEGTWEKPPRDIPIQGHQSVKYMETHSLEHLDQERW
jgi:hypothetical protein